MTIQLKRGQTAFLTFALLILQLGFANWAEAAPHEGRRYEILVLNDKLYAQGINNGQTDGLPTVRPYLNSIHDHWVNVGDGTANASLPAYDLFDTQGLVGHGLFLNLESGFKWSQPPLMPPPGTVPDFDTLEADEVMSIFFNNNMVETDSLGKLFLSNSVDSHGFSDLDFQYTIGIEPTNEIYVLEWTLVSTNPDIEASDSIYTILAPDGSTPQERLHHASLYLEGYLGVTNPVPEPSGALLLSLVVTGIAIRRRR